MTDDLHMLDPRGLIAEAYRIEGITSADCRSIFFDWALGLEEAADAPAAVAVLHSTYRAAAPDHPMTAVLAEGLKPHTRRRRGRRAPAV
ncbi:MAG: hypothetical protein AAF281_07165 [Pseudomonadota bacterium]